MSQFAAVLTLLLAAAQSPAAQPDPAVRKAIATFVGHLQAGRISDAYLSVSNGGKLAFGQTQMQAYIASRRRVLGKITGVTNIRRAPEVDGEEGLTVYQADVRFEKGTAPSWFLLTHEEDDVWRVAGYGLHMPENTVATHDDKNELLPIATEILMLMSTYGPTAIVDLFSEEDLAAVQQTPEMVLGLMEMHQAVLGRLQKFSVTAPEDAPDEDEKVCRNVRGEGTFQYGTAPITLMFCWTDGLWRLRHAQITPQMNPAMLERSLEWALKGKVKAKCPADAAFPVGGKIVCRLTPQGEPPQDATILRTTASGWEIVGLAPVRH